MPSALAMLMGLCSIPFFVLGVLALFAVKWLGAG
jgi:hypothetical protein